MFNNHTLQRVRAPPPCTNRRDCNANRGERCTKLPGHEHATAGGYLKACISSFNCTQFKGSVMAQGRQEFNLKEAIAMTKKHEFRGYCFHLGGCVDVLQRNAQKVVPLFTETIGKDLLGQLKNIQAQLQNVNQQRDDGCKRGDGTVVVPERPLSKGEKMRFRTWKKKNRKEKQSAVPARAANSRCIPAAHIWDATYSVTSHKSEGDKVLSPPVRKALEIALADEYRLVNNILAIANSTASYCTVEAKLPGVCFDPLR